MVSRSRVVLSLALCALIPARVAAWGFDAHELAARISQVFLNPQADSETRRILNGQPMARYATYADAYCRQPGNGWCSPMHYINTADGQCFYNPQTDCDNGACVANAMANYTQRLLSNASVDQFLDLAMLIHFTQDMSQPLHAGQRSDRGGNSVTGTFFGSNTNLHSMWDTALPRRRWETDFQGVDDYEKYLIELLEGPLAPQAEQWTACLRTSTPYATCYNEWTSESALSCCTVGYRDHNGNLLPNPFELGQEYYAHAVQTLETHILKAAARVAAIMNMVFSGKMRV